MSPRSPLPSGSRTRLRRGCTASPRASVASASCMSAMHAGISSSACTSRSFRNRTFMARRSRRPGRRIVERGEALGGDGTAGDARAARGSRGQQHAPRDARRRGRGPRAFDHEPRAFEERAHRERDVVFLHEHDGVQVAARGLERNRAHERRGQPLPGRLRPGGPERRGLRRAPRPPAPPPPAARPPPPPPPRPPRRPPPPPPPTLPPPPSPPPPPPP